MLLFYKFDVNFCIVIYGKQVLSFKLLQDQNSSSKITRFDLYTVILGRCYKLS